MNQTIFFRCSKRRVLMYRGGCEIFFCFKNNAKNIDTHSYITMKNGNVDMHGKEKYIYTKMSCFHIKHSHVHCSPTTNHDITP